MEKRVFGIFFFSMSLIVTTCFAQENEPYQNLQDQAEVIAAQAGIACSSQNSSPDSIALKTAERITSSDGQAYQLLKTVQQAAKKTNDDLERSEELVQQRFLPKWQKQVDNAKSDLENKISNLSNRSPATSFEKSESMRDQVKAAYTRYQSLKTMDPQKAVSQDPETAQLVKAQVKALRSQKLKELGSLSKIGDRLVSSINQASTCQCRLGGDNSCKSTETLKEEAQYYDALKGYKASKAHATYDTTATGSTASVGN